MPRGVSGFTKQLEEGALNAPSYYSLKNDGAPMRCDSCGGYAPLSHFLMIFLPNGRNFAAHKECIFPEWLADAKDMGEWRG